MPKLLENTFSYKRIFFVILYKFNFQINILIYMIIIFVIQLF